MNWSAQVAITGLGMVLIISYGCSAAINGHSANNSADSTINPQQSDEAAEIQRAWEKKVNDYQIALNKTKKMNKGFVKEKFEFLEDLLEAASTKTVSSELKRLEESPVPYNRMSEFEQTFLQVHVDRYEELGKRKPLVDLLSKKCPRYVGYAPIEVSLTTKGHPEKFLILFDAYERASNGTSRDAITRILAAVFKDLRRQYKDDTKFVELSKQWYLNNRTNLIVNPNYYVSFDPTNATSFFLPLK